MQLIHFDLRAKFSLGLALLGLACDPAGPSAAGNIALGSSVDQSAFTTFDVRVYPDTSGAFDADKVPETSPGQVSLALKDLTFPYHYDAGEALATTDEKHWRMTAWLSKGASSKPSSNDPQCSVAFELEACGAQFGGYCGTKSDIDCTLE